MPTCVPLQVSKTLREVYVGGLPANAGVTPIILRDFFNTVAAQLGLARHPGPPILSARISSGDAATPFGFLEARSAEEADALLQLNNVPYGGSNLRVIRPRQFGQQFSDKTAAIVVAEYIAAAGGGGSGGGGGGGSGAAATATLESMGLGGGSLFETQTQLLAPPPTSTRLSPTSTTPPTIAFLVLDVASSIDASAVSAIFAAFGTVKESFTLVPGTALVPAVASGTGAVLVFFSKLNPGFDISQVVSVLAGFVVASIPLRVSVAPLALVSETIRARSGGMTAVTAVETSSSPAGVAASVAVVGGANISPSVPSSLVSSSNASRVFKLLNILTAAEAADPAEVSDLKEDVSLEASSVAGGPILRVLIPELKAGAQYAIVYIECSSIEGAKAAQKSFASKKMGSVFVAAESVTEEEWAAAALV